MPATPVIGEQVLLGIGPVGGNATVVLEYLSESLSKNAAIRDFGGNRGSSEHANNRMRNVGGVPGGSITTKPNVAELTEMLKYLRSAPIANNFGWVEALTEFTIQKALGATLHTFNNCKAAAGAFSSRPGDGLSFVFSLLALSATKATASFPAITVNEATQPFEHEDLVLTVAGTVVDCLQLGVTIDTGLRARKPNNLAATALYRTESMIQWNITIPYGDSPALFDANGTGPGAGSSVTAVYTNGTNVLTLSSPKVQFSPLTPAVDGREEVPLQLSGMAGYNAAAGDTISISLV